MGLSRSMVTQVIYGYARSKRVEERIAQILGKSINVIWATPKPVLRRAKPVIAGAAT